MKREIMDEYGDKISYFESDIKKEQVFNAVIDWCKKYDLYCGESITQSDNGNLEAPVLLSEIVDEIIGFQHIDSDTPNAEVL